jgi:dolichol-phosphate mannosyltransferase
MATSAQPVQYSIIVPVFNEEAVIPVLLHQLDALIGRLDGAAEIIIVDDGSTDSSSIVLRERAKSDSRYRYIGLTRNFGHQIAITAGLDAARGDAVIVMDADLQDPPEVVERMIARWKDGFDVVYARRVSRDSENAFKRLTSSLFYRVLRRMSSVDIPQDVGDFRLVDRRVLDMFRAMPEQDRFVRGMFAWLGFRQASVDFHRPARAAGTTKYPLWKMARLAVNGLIGFSDAPLRAAIWLGLAVSAFAMVFGLYAIARYLESAVIPGWTSTIVIVSFFSGINLMVSGVIGLYIGRIHAEVKRRPLYVVDQDIGMDRIRNAPAKRTGQAAPAAAKLTVNG